MTILGLQHRGEFCIQISMSIEQNIHKTCIGMHRGGKKTLKFENSEIFYFICMPYEFMPNNLQTSLLIYKSFIS